MTRNEMNDKLLKRIELSKTIMQSFRRGDTCKDIFLISLMENQIIIMEALIHASYEN